MPRKLTLKERNLRLWTRRVASSEKIVARYPESAPAQYGLAFAKSMVAHYTAHLGAENIATQ